MRRRLHDLTLAIEGDARALAVAADLLGPLAVADPTGEPDLRVILRWADPGPLPSGPSLLFHGPVRVYPDAGGLLVSDGHSRLRVLPGGREIQVDIAEASLLDGQAFAQVVLFMAVILALRWHGLFHLHAGSLTMPDGRGVLVAGTAGAGKSTTTLALLEGGCSYLGDDAAFIAGRPGGAMVVPFPRRFHIAPHTWAAFPRLASLLEPGRPGEDKRRLDPELAWPGRGRDSMQTPSVLLLPRVTGSPETSIAPVSAAEALGALVESGTYVIVEGLPGRTEQWDLLRRVADAVKAYRVDLGTDLLLAPGPTTARILRVI